MGVRGHLRNTDGITYLALMFSIVLIGISVSAAARQWTVMVQREKEADLMAKGIEIQNAIALYSNTMKIGRILPSEIYPQSLAELTRTPKPYLRRVYQDPMSGGDWEYMRAPTGGIMGVRSKSKAKPIKERDFPPRGPSLRRPENVSRLDVSTSQSLIDVHVDAADDGPGSRHNADATRAAGVCSGCSADTGSCSQPLTRLRTPQYPVWL
jgi:type II secretory pathway pseudopilin PulG